MDFVGKIMALDTGAKQEEDGEEMETAVQLTEVTFRNFLTENEYVFVNFYAPWCMHCSKVDSVWQTFAGHAPLTVGSVDCVAHSDICHDQHINAYPTLRLFKDGKVIHPRYSGERTVEAFMDFVGKIMALVTSAPAEEDEEEVVMSILKLE